ncbi:hypothetical protein ABZX62_12835 [Streptomyces flavidovirens]|uniref:type II toxin-antitoxin system Phd/YefM family antitoxin n=1 Tax=Streptomyces flavidovirens TaxID=67298 RepID=UPI0033BC6A04
MARVEAGETVTITRDGVPIGDIVPRGVRTGRPAYPFRTDPMGPLDLPDLGGQFWVTRRSTRLCGERARRMTDISVAIADTNALYRLFTPKDPRHAIDAATVTLPDRHVRCQR